MRALRLLVILDATAARGRDLAAIAAAAAQGGATMLQVRDKSSGAGDLAALVRRVIAAAPGVPVTVNDRLDVAIAAGAAGCHLGQDDFPIAEARQLAPAGFLLGGSAGNDTELSRVLAQQPDYLGIGPVHVSPSKADAGAAIGVEGFRRLCAAARGVPCVAIGGIQAADVAPLRAAGAAGVAVIGAVLSAADVEAATRALL